MMMDYISKTGLEIMGNLVELLKPKFMPVAIYHLGEMPDYAELPDGEHCVIRKLLIPALNGRTVAVSRDEVGCRGAWNGLGFGGEAPEERDMLTRAYSTGTEDRAGRHFFCCPELVRSNYIEKVPVYGDGSGYVVFQPLDQAESMNAPVETVVFIVDALELSAMITMAEFSRPIGDSVIRSAYALSCEQIYAMPKQEGENGTPRMVLGMTEFYTRRFIDQDRMSLSMPYSLYRQMDEDCPFSFLKEDRWRESAKPVENS